MNSYDGWLVINKPKGGTSNDAVRKIKKLVGKNNKVGHAGTLDPLAQGILPIAIGEATKTTQYLMGSSKEYEFDATWGEERTTGDAEGEVTFSGGHTPTLDEIEKALPQFIGEIMQMPPIYSALKIKGQPAHKLARKGIEVELSPRKIYIENIIITNHNPENNVTSFKVTCGKGTYIRSLAVDIARSISTYSYVSYLNRTKVGNFLIKNAIILESLTDIVHNDEILQHLLPVTYGLGDILALEVTANEAKSIRNGLHIFLQDHSQISEPIVQILTQGILQAIVSIDKGLCKPIRIFNLN